MGHIETLKGGTLWTGQLISTKGTQTIFMKQIRTLFGQQICILLLNGGFFMATISLVPADTVAKLEPDWQGAPKVVTAPVIETHGLSKTYKGVQAVKALN
jgi:hypothetical protein